MPKPGKVQAIAIYTLVLGILHGLVALMLIAYGLIAGLLTFGIGCIVWILVPIPLVTSILEIVYATKMLPDPVRPNTMGKIVAIAEISNVLYCGVLGLTGGILSLVFYSDPEVKAYLQACGADPS